MRDKTTPRVAVIADDEVSREELLRLLGGAGWHAWGTGSAAEFLGRSAGHGADLALVHVDLTDPGGLDVLRQLRETGGLGIVAVSTRGSVRDRVRGLELGADHCLLRPFEPDELHSTLRALWRRIRGHFQRASDPQGLPGEAAAGGWVLDAAARSLRGPEQAQVALSDQELALLACLMRIPGRVVPKRELLSALYPDEPDPDPHRIEVILSRARRKALAAGVELPVRAVFGKGVAFLPRESVEAPKPAG